MAARMQLMIYKKRVLDERRGFRDPLLSPFFFEAQGNLESLLSKFLWNFDRNSSQTFESDEHTVTLVFL
jgi:hypothetical protein